MYVHYLISFPFQKPKDESEENELKEEEETESCTVESGRTDSKQMVTNTDQQHDNELDISERNEENIADLSRTEIRNATKNDENNESSTLEITTRMETLTTNSSTLNDSRDNDEGFEENDNDDDDDDWDSNSDGDSNDDDDDGWITPANISHIKNQMGKGTLDAIPANVTVGCLTTDFAVQVKI